MKSTKGKKLLSLVLLLIILLGACAPPAQAPAAAGGAAAPASSKVELHFRILDLNRSDDEKKNIQTRIEDFMKNHPETTVITEVAPFDPNYTQLRTGVASGTAPDLAEVRADHITALAQQNVLEPISENAFGFPWQALCYWQIVLPKSGKNLDSARTLVDFLAQKQSCQVAYSDVETWLPYPTPPSQNIIGDAELVPGSPELVNAIAVLSEILKANDVHINSARTVRLADKDSDNFTYSAPLDHDVPAIRDKDSFDKKLAEANGLITGVMVVPEKNDLNVPPGSYAERMFLQDNTKQIQLIGSDGKVYYQTTASPEDADGHLADDNYPTAAISYGSKKCRKCYPWGCCLHRCP